MIIEVVTASLECFTCQMLPVQKTSNLGSPKRPPRTQQFPGAGSEDRTRSGFEILAQKPALNPETPSVFYLVL